MLKVPVINMDVNVTSMDEVLAEISQWSLDAQGRYICVSNVHMCMEVFDNKNYASVVNGSDFTVPDGKPISWALQALRFKEAKQVRGEDLTLAICKKASLEGIPMGFFGSTDNVLELLSIKLLERFSGLNLAYVCAPPFTSVTHEQDRQYIDAINSSGVAILFVGLGCPKQEVWMALHRDQLTCTMIGVGAAFDFIAGTKSNAPNWVQKIGMEWFFRLMTEPRRLWRRYFKQNPRFIWYFGLQLLGRKH